MESRETGPSAPSDPPKAPEPAASGLQRISERLDSLARELDSEPDEQRAAELVREASGLATEAGREVERAVRSASEPR